MRHRHGLKKMGRSSSHRLSTLRNMASALFLKGRIQTTLAKAKALRPFAERLVTIAKAKHGILHASRLLFRHLHDKKTTHHLVHEVGPQQYARPGGYTRILRTGFRRGDNAAMALIALVEPYAAPASSAASQGDHAPGDVSSDKVVEAEL